MARLSLCLIGVAAAVAAVMTYKNRLSTQKRIPVKQAAALLQEAWADAHTRV